MIGTWSKEMAEAVARLGDEMACGCLAIYDTKASRPRNESG